MFRSLLLASLLTASSVPTSAWADLPAKVSSKIPKSRLGKGNWEYLETKKDIRLSRKLVGDGGLFAVRGETVVKSPIGKVISAVYDETRWTEWTKIMGAKLLKLHSDNQKTVYQSFDMPMVLSDRDVIYTFGVWETGETTFISGWTNPAVVVNEPKTIGVRMNLVAGDWYLTPTKDGHTHVILEVLMDPKGILPAFFVNIAQRDYPVTTLVGLKKQAAKPGVKTFPRASLTKLSP